MKRGRFIAYDKQKVLEDIVRGRLSAAEIAQKHGITRGMVYTLKYQAKKRRIIRDPIQRMDDLDAPKSNEGAAQEIYQLARQFKAGDLDELDFYQSVRRITSS